MVITSKEIHLAIKRGETAEEFASKHGITIENLFSYIDTKIHAGANNLIRGFDKNAKARSKELRRIRTENEVESKNENEDIEVVSNSTEEVKSKAQEMSIIEPQSKPQEMNLEQLKNDETELSIGLCNLEKDHAYMAERRRQILSDAKHIGETVLALQQALEAEESKVEEFIAEYKKLADDMNCNTRERRVYEDLLSEIRQQIEELSKVFVIGRQDGTLECNHPEIANALSAEDELRELNTLMSIPEAEDYTLKQLKSIARSKLLEKLGATVQFEFPLFCGNDLP